MKSRDTTIEEYLQKAVELFYREIAPILYWPLVKITLTSQKLSKERPSTRHLKQQVSLRALISHAERRIPYYRLTHRVLGLARNSEWNRADFQTLPCINRKTLQKYHGFFSRPGFRQHLSAYQITSGTTGSPLVVPITQARMIHDAVDMALQASRLGITVSARRALRTNYVYITDALGIKAKKRLSVFKLSRFRKYPIPTAIGDNTFAVIQEIERHNPTFLAGKASSLVHLARMCEKAGYPKPGGIRPQLVFSGAEYLFESDRRLMERIFKGTVVQHYGLTETGVIGWECSQKDGYHFREDRFLVEILRSDDHGDDLPRNSGEIVVTDLKNKGFPLIRYRTGDLGEVEDSGCPCGSSSPKLKLYTGRLTDYFLRSDGSRLNPFGLTLDLRKLPVDQFQLIQEAVNVVKIKFSGPVSSSEVLQSVKKRAQVLLDSEAEVTTEHIEYFPQTKEKFRPYICMIEETGHEPAALSSDTS